MNGYFVLLASPIISASLSLNAPADEPERLKVMRAQFEELREDVFSAQEKFDERYLGELKKLEEKAKDDGKLELLLEIRKEADGFRQRKGRPSEPSILPELARMQVIYAEQTARIDADIKSKLASLVAGYQKQLADLSIDLTKAGQIDSALAVREEMKRLDTQSDPTYSPVKGRIVRIDLPGTQHLCLAEIQVFQDGKNMALEGTANQSSTHRDSGSPPADRAIDGNTDGNFAARSTTHSEGGDTNPWWEVDLGDTERIDRIVVWNRTDQNLQFRLNGFKLSVLDAERETVWEKTFPKAPENDLEIDLMSTPGSTK